jgi:hypothetical protein
MKTFLCSGRLGDFFHQLYVVKTICKNSEEKAHIVIGDDRIHEKIYHGQCDFWSPLEDAVEELKPLLLEQDYIEIVEPFSDHNIEDFDYVPAYYRKSNLLFSRNWTEIYSTEFNLDLPKFHTPWIEIEGDARFNDKVVIHRTRKENDYGFSDRCTHLIDWEEIVRKNDCVFVGYTEIEYNVFKKNFPSVSHLIAFQRADSHLQMAKIIKGCKYFIGNQTSPLALAFSIQAPMLAELAYGDSIHYEKEDVYLKDFSWVSNVTKDYYLNSNLPGGVKIKFTEPLGEHTLAKKPNVYGKLV